MLRILVVLALCAAFASPAFPETSASSAIREITIGRAVPSGQTFGPMLDERGIDRAYPEWARSLPGAWTMLGTREQFKSLVRDVVNRELAARFPDGLPDAASRMKIEIKVRLGQSPEIIVGC
jgi:hypothetical protein